MSVLAAEPLKSPRMRTFAYAHPKDSRRSMLGRALHGSRIAPDLRDWRLPAPGGAAYAPPRRSPDRRESAGGRI